MKKKVLLFVNNKKSSAASLADQICSTLGSRSYDTDIFSFENKTEQCKPENVTIGFSLGGDGTVLYTSRIMGPLDVPVLPVNLGTLGFIAAVPPAQWEETFNQWEKGQAIISRRLMLDVTVERNGKTIFSSCCLNDVVVSSAGIAKLIRLEVEAETAVASGAGTAEGNGAGNRIGLGRFRADGLIVSTPTGSTGYSVAAGGPIIDPEMDAVIINPICPFTIANRPIVVPSEDRIVTLVEREQRSDVLLTVDGQITEPLQSDDRIIICRAARPLKLVASDRWAFYRALRTKLAWSGGESNA